MSASFVNTQNKRGFTLIELLVVISIISILSVVGLVSFQGVRGKTIETKKKADIDSIKKAYETNYDPSLNGGQGAYKPLTGANFANGKIPTPGGGDIAANNTYIVSGPVNTDPPAPNFALAFNTKTNTPCSSLNEPGCYSQASTQGTTVDLNLLITPVGSIPGLKLWLKADAITGLNDGAVVTTWNDSSSNNNNATQSNEGYKPVYKTNIVNGKPVLQFYGKFMDTGAFIIKQVYMVYKSPNAAFNTYGGPLGVINYGDGRPFIFEAGQTFFHSNPYPLSVWKNGTQITTSPYNMTPVTSWMVLTLNTANPNNSRAYRIGGSEGYLASLDIAEIIGYDNILSDVDRKKVEGYLGSKYGITISN